MTFQDTYDYKKIPPKITAYKGQIFRSQLEATWAMFFDWSVYKWEYEPQERNLFRGWLPDFKVWLNPEDCPIYCEVKPLMLIEVPSAIASKIIQAESRCCGESDNNVITAILGKQAPVWHNKQPSLGWVSFGKKGYERKWQPMPITNAQVAEFRWNFAQIRVKRQFVHVRDATRIFLLSLENQNRS
ncbi:hypothetical protein NIES267_74220 (plasmid) [Calothrix parasitica NIES-267]|uniref:Uncharacterized protein n=1 Tax=Calothrix parasitica NIES-267 TaxID=1973488 RepID=A0A1Z4M3E0_9CYAN|nr:hypothetical protein NIES267_74220 [Calothrix parasitica NIES-267]